MIDLASAGGGAQYTSDIHSNICLLLDGAKPVVIAQEPYYKAAQKILKLLGVNATPPSDYHDIYYDTIAKSLWR